MRLKADYFGTTATREIYDRIHEIMDDADSIPTFRVLRRDSRLSVEAKALLKGSADTILTKAEIDVTMSQLRDSYVLRVYSDLNEYISKQLSGNKAPKMSTLEQMVEETLYSVRNPEGTANDLLHGGTGDTKASDMLLGILKGKHAKDRIKTGWGTFDTKTGGFSRGDLVVLTANFGGGKSVGALTLFKNMRNKNYSVALASMEMGQEEILERLSSSISDTEYSKIRLNEKLSREDKKRIIHSFDEFDDKSKGARWTIYTPSNEVTIKDIFLSLSPYKYDVIFIDYIGLLKQVSTQKNAREDQILGEAARYCKIMAQKLDCVVVLLAQLNEEGKVSYSRAITHHANFWFKWQCAEEDKGRGFVTVEQGKARGADTYDFYLTTEFSKMMMNDYTGAVDKAPSDSESPKNAFRRGKGGTPEPKKNIKMSLLEDS